MTTTHKRVVLAARPEGTPRPSDFLFESAPRPTPAPGELLLRTRYLSLDPYLRGRMGSSASHSSGTTPVPVGAVMEGLTVGEVVVSTDSSFEAGEIVVSPSGWQEYAAVPAAAVRRIDPTRAPITTALGVLGMPGLTAYAAMRGIAQPRPGECVVVAAASGTVGALAGQIARLDGARVVGIAGGERKVAWLREAGFNVALDHRDPDLEEKLAAAAPEGIDVYMENVGGRVWDAVWPRLNRHARVPICGIASAYSSTTARSGGDIAELMSGLVTRSITLRGFVFRDYEHLRPQFEDEVAGWLRSGAIVHHEEIVPGLERAPEAFIGMLAGQHLGKRLIQVG